MPKELTHLIIARNVLSQFKSTSLGPLEEIIETHKKAFYLGSIIPDAFFYNILPWPQIPGKISSVSNALHQPQFKKNDRTAAKLFIAALTESKSPDIKVAFSAGMISHTVSDRIFHGVIAYYTRRWGESGTKAMGTHRQLETLFDKALLEVNGESQRDYSLKEKVSLLPGEMHCLLQFSVAHLLAPPSASLARFVLAFRWAYMQQLFLLSIFKKPGAHRAAALARYLSAGRSEYISGLFYPPAVTSENFPILKKIDLNRLTDGNDFHGDLFSLVALATKQTVKNIQFNFGKQGALAGNKRKHSLR